MIAIHVLKIVLAALSVLVGLYLLDRVVLWAERKGWIFYRKIKPTGNSLGSSALELQKIFESGKPTHVIEAKHDQTKESADPGSGHAKSSVSPHLEAPSDIN